MVRDLLVLPSACSLLARVTAMHNYTTTNNHHHIKPPPPPPPSSVLGSGIKSAPQSPSAVPLRQCLDRRCLSTPASPSAITTATTTAGVRRSGRRRGSGRGTQRATDSEEDSVDCGRHVQGGTRHSVSGGIHHAVGGNGSAGSGFGGKRAHHNVLERRRRDDLKLSFEALRAVVPHRSGTSNASNLDVRVPKVAILRRARDYVRQLTQASLRLNSEYTRLTAVHQRWTHRLSLLRKDLDSDAASGSTWLRCSEH